jgi:hypothetical protein
MEGYYINKSDDTIRATFKIPFLLFEGRPDFEKIQWKMKYRDSVKKKHILLPSEAKEVFFKSKKESFRMLSRYNTLSLSPQDPGGVDNTYVFLHLVEDGRLKLFKFYKSKSGVVAVAPGPFMAGGAIPLNFSFDKYIFQKEKGNLFRPDKKTLRDEMIKYLSDCPEVAKKYEEKRYPEGNVYRSVARDYNQMCK